MGDFYDWFFGDSDDMPHNPYSPMDVEETRARRFSPDFELGDYGRGRDWNNRRSQFNMPQGPPPAITPSLSGIRGTQYRNPPRLRNCLYRFIFMFFRNRQRAWVWLTSVDNRNITGFRWNGRQWVFFRANIRDIVNYICF